MIPEIMAPTIMQLRAYCTPLGGRVAGAANYEQGLQKYTTNLPLPAAFVVPLSAESDGFANMIGAGQFVRQMLGIVVELDARTDRRGQDPAERIAEMESALCASVLNWVPATCYTVNQQGYWLAGRHTLDLDRARLFVQWEFGLNTQLDDTDGWTPPSVPLESIEVDIYAAPPWAMVPTPSYPPGAIIKIPTAGPVESWDAGGLWDDPLMSWDSAPQSRWDGNSGWDDGNSWWDA